MKKVYIDKDKDGNIKAIYACKQRSGQEKLEPTHPDIVKFKERQTPKKTWNANQQLDYLAENGFDAWVAERKARK